MVMGRQDYHWQHEPCLYGWKDGAAHLWAADRKQTTISNFDRPSCSAEHPTMKPVELFEYQMLNYTKGMDTVLDSFAGSGTTIIACEKHRRKARAMELDPVYCDVAIKRWQDYTGGEAIHEETEHEWRRIELRQKIIEWVAGIFLFVICLGALIGLVLLMRSTS